MVYRYPPGSLFLSFRSGCFWRILAGRSTSISQRGFEKTIKRRLTEAGDRELADDGGPIISTVAKLVDALQRAVPRSRDLPMHRG